MGKNALIHNDEKYPPCMSFLTETDFHIIHEKQVEMIEMKPN